MGLADSLDNTPRSSTLPPLSSMNPLSSEQVFLYVRIVRTSLKAGKTDVHVVVGVGVTLMPGEERWLLSWTVSSPGPVCRCNGAGAGAVVYPGWDLRSLRLPAADIKS